MPIVNIHINQFVNNLKGNKNATDPKRVTAQRLRVKGLQNLRIDRKCGYLSEKPLFPTLKEYFDILVNMLICFLTKS